MRRHLASAAIAAGLLLALAGPAAAWDAVGVAITDSTGGGAFAGTGGEAVPNLLMSDLLPSRPAGDLGPRFQVSYTWAATGQALAVQDLYPYAPGGPVTFTPTSGAIASHAYAAGWRQADETMFKTLVAWGLPAESGQAAQPAEAGAPRSAAPAGEAGSILDPARIAVGTLGLLALAALVLVGGARSRDAGRQHA
jgi:hypothetical protein